MRHLGKAESRSGTEVPVYPRRTHRRRRRGIRVGARTRALPRATVSVGLAAASGTAPGTPSGAVSTLAGAAPLPPPGAQPGRRGTLPDVPAAGLKGPVPAPCPHPSLGEAAPLKGAAPGRPHPLSRGLALQGRAGRGAAGALKGTGKVSAGVPTSPPRVSLPGGGEEGASCLLKGQLRPLGATIRLRASLRMYPWEMGGPSRGPFLTAAPQGHWARNASSALPLPSPPLPFREPTGLGGGGRASPSGLRSASLLAPSALSRGLGAAPGNPGTIMGQTSACELSSGLRRLGPGGPGSIPRGSLSRCPTARGCRPASRCGPAARPRSPGAPRRAQRGWL